MVRADPHAKGFIHEEFSFMHENEISMHENEISMHENEISMHENEISMHKNSMHEVVYSSTTHENSGAKIMKIMHA